VFRSIRSGVKEDNSESLLRESLWIKKKKFVECFGDFCGDFSGVSDDF